MTPALVSFCVPTYQRAHFLTACLDSLFAQTYAPCEVIVSDNGSTDATADILDAYQKRHRNIHVVRHPANLGMAHNWLAAMTMASGEYIALINDDDWCLPHFADILVDLLRGSPTAAMALGTSLAVDQRGNPLRDRTEEINRGRTHLPEGIIRDALAHAFNSHVFTATTALFRTSALRQRRFVDVAAGPMLDYDLLLSLAHQNDPAILTHNTVSAYRLHPDQQTLGQGGDRNWSVNSAHMCYVLSKYAFADRELERQRRRRLGWLHSVLARQHARTDHAAAWRHVRSALRYPLADPKYWARLASAVGSCTVSPSRGVTPRKSAPPQA